MSTPIVGASPSLQPQSPIEVGIQEVSAPIEEMPSQSTIASVQQSNGEDSLETIWDSLFYGCAYVWNKTFDFFVEVVRFLSCGVFFRSEVAPVGTAAANAPSLEEQLSNAVTQIRTNRESHFLNCLLAMMTLTEERPNVESAYVGTKILDGFNALPDPLRGAILARVAELAGEEIGEEETPMDLLDMRPRHPALREAVEFLWRRQIGAKLEYYGRQARNVECSQQDRAIALKRLSNSSEAGLSIVFGREEFSLAGSADTTEENLQEEMLAILREMQREEGTFRTEVFDPLMGAIDAHANREEPDPRVEAFTFLEENLGFLTSEVFYEMISVYAEEEASSGEWSGTASET